MYCQLHQLQWSHQQVHIYIYELAYLRVDTQKYGYYICVIVFLSAYCHQTSTHYFWKLHFLVTVTDLNMEAEDKGKMVCTKLAHQLQNTISKCVKSVLLRRPRRRAKVEKTVSYAAPDSTGPAPLKPLVSINPMSEAPCYWSQEGGNSGSKS